MLFKVYLLPIRRDPFSKATFNSGLGGHRKILTTVFSTEGKSIELKGRACRKPMSWLFNKFQQVGKNFVSVVKTKNVLLSVWNELHLWRQTPHRKLSSAVCGSQKKPGAKYIYCFYANTRQVEIKINLHTFFNRNFAIDISIADEIEKCWTGDNYFLSFLRTNHVF